MILINDNNCFGDMLVSKPITKYFKEKNTDKATLTL